MEVYKIFQHGSGQQSPCCGVLMSVLLMETFRNTLFAHLYVCQRFTANPEPISLGFNAVLYLWKFQGNFRKNAVFPLF